MNILSAEKLAKAFSEKTLFRDSSLNIEDGDKVGVLGVNGAGKSTLLKIISGEEPLDAGKIITSNKAIIEYLPQNPAFEKNVTVLQQIFKSNSPIMNLLRDYEHTISELEANPESEQYSKKFHILTQMMDQMNAWTIESEVKTILTKLGIKDFDLVVETLSGGQRKRIALASALINPADLLILDEPTNQLDNDTVDWLEKYLNARKGALLMVTHDRYFLRRVCNRIVEIDRGKIYSYQTNYEKFLELKSEREESDLASDRKRMSLFRKELEWMKRGPRARSTKQKARIERFDELKETKSVQGLENIEISVGVTRLGKKIIELEGISKSYSEYKLIDNFSYQVKRDDRIGIIGPNGSGKSTLLKMIAGRILPDSGNIGTGETVKIGFFTQENDEIDETLRVIEYIREEAEYLTTKDGQISASQMLENFLFPPADQWSLISTLSGGEKRRLYLLRILMSAPNVILLDEPTNDLDIETLTILEYYLNDFSGAVIAVSHDRYFLDRVAETLFIFEGDTTISRFQGCYTDYYEKKLQDISIAKEVMAKKSMSKSSSANLSTGKLKEDNADKSSGERKPTPLKFTYKEQKEFDVIDEKLANLETELKETESGIIDASSDYEKLQKLFSKKEQLENEQNETMERWVYLTELFEKIKKD